MCNHNPCEGRGWLSFVVRYGAADYAEEQEPCPCNPAIESLEEHSDKECARDVTLAP